MQSFSIYSRIFFLNSKPIISILESGSSCTCYGMEGQEPEVKEEGGMFNGNYVVGDLRYRDQLRR